VICKYLVRDSLNFDELSIDHYFVYISNTIPPFSEFVSDFVRIAISVAVIGNMSQKCERRSE
jgi:hypothetical protein